MLRIDAVHNYGFCLSTSPLSSEGLFHVRREFRLFKHDDMVAELQVCTILQRRNCCNDHVLFLVIVFCKHSRLSLSTHVTSEESVRSLQTSHNLCNCCCSFSIPTIHDDALVWQVFELPTECIKLRFGLSRRKGHQHP